MKDMIIKSSKSAKLKIFSRKGETLAEVLVALLIASLAVAMLAGMIQASVKIIDSAESKMQEYYVASNALALKTPAASTGDGKVSLSYEDSSHMQVTVRLIPDSDNVDVDYFTNNKLGAIDVISYKRK